MRAFSVFLHSGQFVRSLHLWTLHKSGYIFTFIPTPDPHYYVEERKASSRRVFGVNMTITPDSFPASQPRSSETDAVKVASRATAMQSHFKALWQLGGKDTHTRTSDLT